MTGLLGWRPGRSEATRTGIGATPNEQLCLRTRNDWKAMLLKYKQDSGRPGREPDAWKAVGIGGLGQTEPPSCGDEINEDREAGGRLKPRRWNPVSRLREETENHCRRCQRPWSEFAGNHPPRGGHQPVQSSSSRCSRGTLLERPIDACGGDRGMREGGGVFRSGCLPPPST